MLTLIKQTLLSQGLSESIAKLSSYLIVFSGVFFASGLVYYIARKYIVRLINLLLAKAHSKIFLIIQKHRLTLKLAHLAPALLLYIASPLFELEQKGFGHKIALALQELALVYGIIALTSGFWASCNVVEEIYNRYNISKKRPIKSYLQIIKAIATIVAIIVAISIFLNESPFALLTGLGAATAVLFLIFQDTIKGFLASIQMASYDMVRIGDWISLPKLQADGNVTEISLTTLKVQNWDRTITTIPSYSILTEGVRNWRGMEEAGARRCKRHIRIDLDTIQFCDSKTKSLLEKRNLLINPNKTEQTTNLELFSNYSKNFIEKHPKVATQGFVFMVRQLQSDQHGLPLEFYFFAKTTKWVEYETIVSSIFNHLIANLQFFKLRTYQRSANLSSSDAVS